MVMMMKCDTASIFVLSRIRLYSSLY